MLGISVSIIEPGPITSAFRKNAYAKYQENINKEIADKLFISENTVKTHRKHIMKKLNAKNIASVIGFAYKNHLV